MRLRGDHYKVVLKGYLWFEVVLGARDQIKKVILATFSFLVFNYISGLCFQEIF